MNQSELKIRAANMGKTAILVLTILVICGIAAASAGVVDWDDDTDNVNDDLAVRERREAAVTEEECESSLFKKLNSCCTVPDIYPDSASSKCGGGKQAKSKQAAKKKAKKLKKKTTKNPATEADMSTVPSTAEALARRRRQAAELGQGDHCKGDCIYRGQGLLDDNGDLDVAAAIAAFNTRADATWQAVFAKAAEDCQAQLGDGPASDAGKTKCKAGPGQLMKCIKKALYTNCPAGSKLSDASCDTNLAKVKKCDPFVIDKKTTATDINVSEAAAGGAVTQVEQAKPTTVKSRKHKTSKVSKTKKPKPRPED